MKLKLIPLLLITFIAFNACKEDKPKEPVVEVPVVEETPKEVISIEKLENSPAYEEAALVLNKPKANTIKTAGEINFDFSVNNYQLGAPTESVNATLLANSGSGQHIHFILNNQPYSAHYEPNFSKEVPDGVHHLVAFLSRSYHESVKNKNSVVVRKLEVGKNPVDSLGLDMEAPTLIYSRPKGEYVGAETENLLLDFFVLNTTLSENGNKVKATINGQEFLITEWAPQVIKGLNKGEVTIQLELIDEAGNLIPGPFNNVVRKVTLKD